MSRQKSRLKIRPRRPWMVPPGLLVLSEPFEGFHILEELGNESGLLLWQCLRDVDLWTSADRAHRGVIFADGALHQRQRWLERQPDGVVRRIAESCAVVLQRPMRLRGEEVADLCEEASTWASDTGLPRTAVAFAQRCAMAAPEAAGAAYLVGLLARRNADYKRADTWFRRCLALARRKRDWRHYGMAHIGIANIHIQRGDGAAARNRLTRALRTARRHGLWGVKAMAFHDLFCIEATAGEHALAEGYAKAAYRAYGPSHPRLPALAHDVAWHWVLQKQFHRALPVLCALAPHFERHVERMIVTSSIARAAGGAGETEIFETAWGEVWRMVQTRLATERVAEALVNLAHGAAALGQSVRVEMAASQALTVARRRGEAQERLAAEELLAHLRAAARGKSKDAPAAEETPTQCANADQWASELVAALSESPPPRGVVKRG
ncbi:MAG TPA: tetratricopeptide repeat protein [Longimicrobium sp.]|nr:tetratricopeptide repeat protein [Longimicrobium sp.]